ncbi:hypothetical protein B0H11DRAFT_1905779 [Mycena galericulata]|nr:hypothetical protein B0H11DRAFT_1905779 [Mycena galericulata]
MDRERVKIRSDNTRAGQESAGHIVEYVWKILTVQGIAQDSKNVGNYELAPATEEVGLKKEYHDGERDRNGESWSPICRGSIAGGFWRRVANWAGVASRAVIDVLVVGVIGLYMDSSKWLVEMDEAGTNEKKEKGNRDGPFGVEILRVDAWRP